MTANQTVPAEGTLADSGARQGTAILADGQSPRGIFPIVGVGASAGGLEAFMQFLKAIPNDTGMAFVFVQHLEPNHESSLAHILSSCTAMSVCDATNEQAVRPDCVYVIPPDKNLLVGGGVLTLTQRSRGRTPHRPIDLFFESLAQDRRELAIGVVLSGTGSDGTLGMEAIKVEGGITFAQDNSAKYNSMPHNAENAGCVDFVLSPSMIAEQIAGIAKQLHGTESPLSLPVSLRKNSVESVPRQDNDSSLGEDHWVWSTRGESIGAETIDAANFSKILGLLSKHANMDFSLYKASTIRRRIARRLAINRLESAAEYASFLQGNKEELDSLYSDSLISVTSFFRNPEVFESLQMDILPVLLQRSSSDPIRIWVPGCSSGQEPYSIAMAFIETSENSSRVRNLQVFATDLNEKLLEKARQGRYPKTLADEISPERLERFFVEDNGGYRVSKSLREMVVFAKQNLFVDPPFSKMDLISCRNLLIYLGPFLQKKAIPTFHYALKSGGFLLLGASESIGGFTELFVPVDKKAKTYVKKEATTPSFHIPARRNQWQPVDAERRDPTLLGGSVHTTDNANLALRSQREADRILLHRFSPPGVLVNAELQVTQFRGATSEFLEPPIGKATFHILKMAKDWLLFPLRSALEEAKSENRTTRKENIKFDHDEARCFDIVVTPLKNLPEPCFLVLFEDSGKADQKSNRDRFPKEFLSETEEAVRVSELSFQLSDTREYLLAIQEQHEATTEELQATSDEAQSSNEELQSINEELETSKEELESANEELATVNDELSYRNSELNVLNNDLVNFQDSVKLVVLLLGSDLTIRRFSPQAEKQFSLIGTDIGRPISIVRHQLLETHGGGTIDLESMCIEVIQSGQEKEIEVLDSAGRWFSLRLRPYITPEKKIEGAVLLMIDIDELKRSQHEVDAAREFAENTVDTIRVPLLVLNAELCVESANRSFYRAFHVAPSETIGTFIYDLGNRQWNIPRLRELLEDVLPHSTSIEAFQVEHDFEQLGRRTMLLDARRILDPQRKTKQILIAIEDITDRKELEGKLNSSETLYRRLFETAKDGVLILDGESGKILEANPFMAELSGYPVADFLGKELWEIGLFRDQASNESAIRELQQKGFVRYDHLPLNSTYEQPVEVEFVSNIYESDHLRVAQCNIRDISVRSRLEKQTQRQAAELSDLHRRKDEFLAMLSHELRSPLAPIANAMGLLSLQKGSENEVQANARGIIERQMKQMQRLVDDLLEVSRITTGQVQLRRERVVISRIVEGAVETARPLIEERKHQLLVSMPPEPIWLDADISRMEQVLVNLLTNAAKYTGENGHIWVTVQQEGESCVIRIRDNGVGIARELLPRIFDLFTQAERSLDRSQGGLGIGLALVKRLCNLHGGTVEVQSDIGQGSEFIVRMPVLPSDAPPERVANSEVLTVAARPLRVLVVDDNMDTVLSFSMLLRALGNTVFTARDGMQAVQSAIENKPDVVLLDIGLPVLNGYEVARRIRLESSLAHVVLIALTGYGQEADRQTALQAGFDHHLVKPARLEQLQKILQTVALH